MSEQWRHGGGVLEGIRIGEAARIRNALIETFETRTEFGPGRLPEPPDSWAVPFRQMARETKLQEDLESAWNLVAAMIDPVIEGRVEHGIWIPQTAEWGN